MVGLRRITVALLLVQVFTTRANKARYVFGPQEHLDSGQPKSTAVDFIPSAYNTDISSEADSHNEYHGSDDYFLDSDYYEHGTPDYSEEWWWEDGDDGDEWSWDDYEHDEWPAWEEEKLRSEAPLKRVRRRIIPVGKALDRDRPDRRGGAGGDAYDRGRSPWAQPPKNRDPVVRRNGPTGSAALFSLYPELAPPEWREMYGNKKGRPKHRERDTEDGDESLQKDDNGPVAKDQQRRKNRKQDEDKADNRNSSETDSKSRAPKEGTRKGKRRKVKLTKELKEEIAIYAQQHGVGKAVAHFRTSLNAPIKAGAVEKFLRRYQNRLLRRGDRKQKAG